MATPPRFERRAKTACYLEPFEPLHAERIAGWVRSPREMYWLAPKTPPPLTTGEVLRWRVPGHQPFLLWDVGHPHPVGYGELNRLASGTGRYWLGHLVVDPLLRGRGYGVALTRLLLRQAFVRCRARQVTLVVFPENARAVACYRAAGMWEDGWETHEFPAYGSTERLQRFVALAPNKY